MRGWTFGIADLAEGTHTLTAVATDATGSTASLPRTITIDRSAPPAPVIALPVDGTTTRDRRISGTAEDGSTVAIFDGTTKLGETPGGTWVFSPPELADGAHTFTAVATDAAGNASQPSAAVHVIVDTVAPEVTFSDVPASPTNRVTFDIGFSANEPAVTFDCVHVFPEGGGEDPLPGCASPFSMRDLTDGTHELRVTAKDPAGNTRTFSVSVTVDATAPDAVEPTQTGAVGVQLRGRGGGSLRVPPHRIVGRHRVRAVRVAAGLSRPAARATTRSRCRRSTPRATAPPRPPRKAFSIAAAPAATPDPTPSATPAPIPPAVVSAAPAAELGRTIVIRPISGKVYVRRPATTALLELGAVAALPVGTEIDARKGRVRLTAAATRGKAAHRAEFFGGMFVVTQAADDVVDLRAQRGPRLVLEEDRHAGPQAVGRRQGPLPHPRAVQRRDRARHALARPGLLRGHADPRLPGRRLGARHRQAQDGPRPRRAQVPGRPRSASSARTT